VIGRIHHVNINCRDIDRQLTFYRDVVGCTVVASAGTSESGAVFETLGYPGERGARTEIVTIPGQDRGPFIELIQWAEVGADKTADPRDIGMVRIGFMTRDVDAEYEALVAKGADVLGPPHESDVGPVRVRAAFFRDPEGNLLEILQYIPKS
jgi:catechol 2,3-dioxygenase-like lactoylglutathione lyase family enzyme